MDEIIIIDDAIVGKRASSRRLRPLKEDEPVPKKRRLDTFPNESTQNSQALSNQITMINTSDKSSNSLRVQSLKTRTTSSIPTAASQDYLSDATVASFGIATRSASRNDEIKINKTSKATESDDEVIILSKAEVCLEDRKVPARLSKRKASPMSSNKKRPAEKRDRKKRQGNLKRADEDNADSPRKLCFLDPEELNTTSTKPIETMKHSADKMNKKQRNGTLKRAKEDDMVIDLTKSWESLDFIDPDDLDPVSLQLEAKRKAAEALGAAKARELEEQFRKEEEQAANARELHRAAMLETPTGKAWKFVEGVITIYNKLSSLALTNASADFIKPVATDDIVILTERMLVKQEEFRKAGKPCVIDLGFHYTQPENLQSIQAGGLMTKQERDSNKIRAKHNGSALGDGVYTAQTPLDTLNQRYGNLGLIVARLQGKTGDFHALPQEPVDTVVHQAYVALRTSAQCVALVQYNGTQLHQQGQLCPSITVLAPFYEKLQTLINTLLNIGVGSSPQFRPSKNGWTSVRSSMLQRGLQAALTQTFGAPVKHVVFSGGAQVHTVQQQTNTISAQMPSIVPVGRSLSKLTPRTPITSVQQVPESKSGVHVKRGVSFGGAQLHKVPQQTGPASFSIQNLRPVGASSPNPGLGTTASILRVPKNQARFRRKHAEMQQPKVSHSGATFSYRHFSSSENGHKAVQADLAPIEYKMPQNGLSERILNLPYHAYATETRSSSQCQLCLVSTPVKMLRLNACGHRFHLDCLHKELRHSSCCPACGVSISGIPLGKMPSGSMSVTHLPHEACAGYNNGTFRITYSFAKGIQKSYHPNPGHPYAGTIQIAYLPDSVEGRKLLKRLREAFCHGLTFGIDASLGNGTGNAITWVSIPHKTSMIGGVMNSGYPDLLYFYNCNAALDALNVGK